jgi:hypothetical protein
MLKSAPKGFTLGVKAEIRKNFSICPKGLINVELYGCVLVPRLKIWEANLGSQFGVNVPTFIKIMTSMF